MPANQAATSPAHAQTQKELFKTHIANLQMVCRLKEDAMNHELNLATTKHGLATIELLQLKQQITLMEQQLERAESPILDPSTNAGGLQL